jgi:hypothetical protein
MFWRGLHLPRMALGRGMHLPHAEGGVFEEFVPVVVGDHGIHESLSQPQDQGVAPLLDDPNLDSLQLTHVPHLRDRPSIAEADQRVQVSRSAQADGGGGLAREHQRMGPEHLKVSRLDTRDERLKRQVLPEPPLNRGRIG